MNRRVLLQWLSQALACLCAAVVAVPGVGYILATVRRGSPSRSLVRRVARLADLSPGQPLEVVIQGARRDAWTTYPEQPLGRVWLVRQTDRKVPPENSQVAAFTATCPHLGCHIQFAPGRKKFVCPCHKGVFEVSGACTSAENLGYTNPAPRGMDALDCQLVLDASSSEWWVEVKYDEFVAGRADQQSKS